MWDEAGFTCTYGSLPFTRPLSDAVQHNRTTQPSFRTMEARCGSRRWQPHPDEEFLLQRSAEDGQFRSGKDQLRSPPAIREENVRVDSRYLAF